MLNDDREERRDPTLQIRDAVGAEAPDEVAERGALNHGQQPRQLLLQQKKQL